MTEQANRKRITDISSSRLAELNSGALEAATLTECLAVDFAKLMRSTIPEIGADAVAIIEKGKRAGILKRMVMAGTLIRDHLGEGVFDRLSVHASDTVRGWACFLVGANDNQPVAERLARIQPLADDKHFGVREWSWMAVRPHLAADLDASIKHLANWTYLHSERLRRFASESIRPRGVWCTHIGALKKSPELALAVLEPLRADPAAYVQDSVGNWLNDASKDQPDWVRALCRRWQDELPNNANTKRIIAKALRSIS